MDIDRLEDPGPALALDPIAARDQGRAGYIRRLTHERGIYLFRDGEADRGFFCIDHAIFSIALSCRFSLSGNPGGAGGSAGT